MDFNLWEFILGNLEAAGVIGGYVAMAIIGVELITFASKGKIESKVQQWPKWTQPIIGAMLGVIPGCGGTIIASSMYKNNKLTFGGLFAAFITTLGEGSFVLLGASSEADVVANLRAFAIINIVGFIVGVMVGGVIDVLGIKLNSGEIAVKVEPRNQKEDTFVTHFIESFGFYIVLAIAIFLTPGSIVAFWGGEIESIADLTVWVAIAFTCICILYYLVYRFLYDGDCCSIDDTTIKSTLLESVSDIAMVVSFVFLGLFVANYIIDVVIGPEAFEAWMSSSAFLVVIIAALIGATPGCGGMIAVAVAFTTIANFPMAALIAAAIATSGDGIFPLLAENKKDAMVITVSGLVVALVVGLGALALGI